MKKRTAVIIFCLLALLGLGAGAFSVLTGAKAKQYALRKVAEAVREQTRGLYRFELQDFSVRLLRGEVTLRGLSITPDSLVADSLRQAGAAPHALWRAQVREIRINVKYSRRDLKQGRLEIQRLVIDQPRLEGVRDSVIRSHQDSPAFQSPFKSIVVRKLEVRGGSLAYDHIREWDTVRTRLERFDVRAEELELDSVYDLKKMPVPSAGGLHCRIQGFFRHPASEACALSVAAGEVDMKRGTLTLDSLLWSPDLPRQSFTAQTRTKKDWTRISVPRLAVHGADFRAMLDGRRIHADSVVVRGVEIASYKNRQTVVPQRVKPLFRELPHKLGMPLDIGAVVAHDGQAVYEELPEKGAAAGRIHFERIEARIAPLSNSPAAAEKIAILAAGALMGVGALEARIELPVDSLDEHFTLRGTLSGMDLARMNPMIEPLARIRVRTGNLNRLDFDIEGGDWKGVTHMRFAYDSLRVELLNKAGTASWGGTLLANSVLILHSNPMPGKEIRMAESAAARDPHRSNFNYWWRLCFAGVKESAGLSEKKQGQISVIKGEIDQIKQNRALRRQKKEQAKAAGQ